MLSGNGRHRRPRQAPALVVAAGVTGSAIAIPLLGATGAHAADGVNWDRVAECETGGAWSQNSGNGYYGGLQLSQEAWEQYGGLAYAPSADQASRAQQIRVAEKIHAAQGIAAWPTCAVLSGLGDDRVPADSGTAATGDGPSKGSDTSGTSTAPESAESPEPSGVSGSSGPAGTTEPTSGTSPSSSAPPTPDSSSATEDEPAKSDTSTESDSTARTDRRGSGGSSTATPEDGETGKAGQEGGTSGLTDTGDSGSGRHRGGSADEGTADGRTAGSSGRHASRGEGGAREVVDGSYTVRSGDSLWGIADSLEIDGGWHSLYAGNKTVVGDDPDHILPGQTLTVTGEPVEK
ncbi:transglycosylase family protein [Streptomyces sp. AC627_RSS907]|uniref:LysM peptidoglycan-binding domain-containing protein n=1 Tax=Streptomyces sp. AC627_RSS907 TaxID=2823684 RepID=UPI001C242999|nr:transglycosylase family protein [Streptomyces sp. AC627_RSS907]